MSMIRLLICDGSVIVMLVHVEPAGSGGCGTAFVPVEDEEEELYATPVDEEEEELFGPAMPVDDEEEEERATPVEDDEEDEEEEELLGPAIPVEDEEEEEEEEELGASVGCGVKP